MDWTKQKSVLWSDFLEIVVTVSSKVKRKKGPPRLLVGLKKPAACENIPVFNVQQSHILHISHQCGFRAKECRYWPPGTEFKARKHDSGEQHTDLRYHLHSVKWVWNSIHCNYSHLSTSKKWCPSAQKNKDPAKVSSTKRPTKVPETVPFHTCFIQVLFPAIKNVTCPGECVCSHIVLVKNTEGVSHISLWRWLTKLIMAPPV